MVKKILLIASYFLVAAIVIIGTILLVSYGQGYSYDFKNHKFVANGLLILDSTPGNARLTLDGRLTRRDTPYRSTLRVGTYDVRLEKDGYRTWNKKIQIVASEVVNLAFVILVPKELRSATIANSQETTSLVASSDRKHLAAITAGATPGLWRVAPDKAQATKVFTPAADQTIVGASLSRDGSRALVRIKKPDAISVLYVNMSSGEAQDLTEQYKVAFDDLRFSFSDANRLYWLNADGLRRLDVGSKTMSAVLADKVTNYTYDNDRLIFVQTTPVGKIVAVMDADGGNKKSLIQGLAESPQYLLSYGSYRDKPVLGVVPTSNGQLTAYEDIYSDNPFARVVARDVNRILPSDNGQYIVFTRAKGFGSYDVARSRIYDGLYTDTIDAISWFNGAHVIVNSAGKTRMVEFDGGNSIDIANSRSIPSVGMFDQRRIISVDPATGQINVADLRK